MSIPLSGRAALLLAACGAAWQVAAQTAPSAPPAPAGPTASPAAPVASARPAPPDPLDAKTPVPTTRWESAFARFQRGDGDKPVSWREANDNVTRIGGWRAYAREAQQQAAPAGTAPAANPSATAPVAKPAATPADKAMPMPAGHGGHITP